MRTAWGVDKKDIKTVVHLAPSTTAEAYLQESGRGGRDGSIAKGILLWSLKDSKDFSVYSPDSREASMKEFAETKNCRRQVLLDALGGEQAVCSGCDVCNSKAKSLADLERLEGYSGIKKFIYKQELNYKAHTNYKNVDWKYALHLVQKNKNFYTEEELESVLFEKMNQRSVKVFGKRVWAHSDVAEIVSQLKDSGKITDSGILWKGKLKSVEKSTD